MEVTEWFENRRAGFEHGFTQGMILEDVMNSVGHREGFNFPPFQVELGDPFLHSALHFEHLLWIEDKAGNILFIAQLFPDSWNQPPNFHEKYEKK